MLKQLLVLALAATAGLAAPAAQAVVVKNPGFEQQAAGNARLPASWNFSHAPGCHRVTEGHSPGGKARVSCTLQPSKQAVFTQSVPLALNKAYVLTSALRFALPPKGWMDVKFELQDGTPMYTARACGYSADVPSCAIADRTWTNVGGGTIFVSGKNQHQPVIATFTNGRAGDQSSVDIDNLVVKLYNGD